MCIRVRKVADISNLTNQIRALFWLLWNRYFKIRILRSDSHVLRHRLITNHGITPRSLHSPNRAILSHFNNKILVFIFSKTCIYVQQKEASPPSSKPVCGMLYHRDGLWSLVHRRYIGKEYELRTIQITKKLDFTNYIGWTASVISH